MASVLYSSVLNNTGKCIFIDKTPRYFHIIPELLRVFPNAKFVILLRNPIAVLSSVLETWFNNQPGALMKSYNRLDMVKGPGLLLDGIQKLHNNAIVVRYEDLVTDPEMHVRALSERLSLTFNPQMLDYQNSKQPQGRFGDQGNISKHSTPVADSVEKWHTSLATDELARFAYGYLNSLGREVITKLGYDFETISNTLLKLTTTR
jgi:hypothetical protein